MYFKNLTKQELGNPTVKGLDNELFQRHVIAEVVTHFITSDYCFILNFYIVLYL